MTRRRARVDGPHTAIVAAMRAVGWFVADTSRLGDGFPDLVAARAGQLVLIEVKNGAKKLSAQALTMAEAGVHRDFAAAGVPVRLIRSVDEALKL